MAEHGVKAASADAAEQSRSAEAGDVFRRVPARLGNDADAVAVGFEQAAEERCAKGRVVDVGVARDEQDISPCQPRRLSALVMGSMGMVKAVSWSD